MALRLGSASLATVPAGARPLVAPGAVRTGIVHVGLGAFFRAHQAVFTEQAVAAGGGDWGIAGVAPHSVDVLDALRAQDGLFSVTSSSAAGAETRVVGALSGLRHAGRQADEVVRLLADPAVRVVTLTITEKGYTPTAPVPQLLRRGLAARRRADAGPIALVSCDNLPANGRWLRRVMTGLAEDGLREWLDRQVSFPGTMVDRIVPATTRETLALAARNLGVDDLAAVSGEPYSQWVIEDDFPGGRPAWERAGAVLTTDAQPWERLKLRTLNGVHSAIAYLGALAGRETIAAALTIPGLAAVLRRLIAQDIAPSLVPPPGVTVVDYGESVLSRFANPAIGHRTVQVAMDGSQKLPQRVLHTILDRRAAGTIPVHALLVVAAWMRFVQGSADDGRPLPLDDPLAGRIRALLAAGVDTPAGVVESLLQLDEVFPAAFTEDEVVRAGLVQWLTALDKHGVEATVAGVA
ncbi:mannitol dehydrogenase family protein [Actinoplanes sp. N902-109]|uniref:mannitol dehydrogenase family protein n=1 Tax=Actinoplanes sp. (strain N902-109) TaxID=649831 RepID=UPI0003295E37|nr:mannitol dehydrogenase family protein [Actinoplanes sp. N902-109]AGL17296.1 mannitol dehydrogenase domain-containing protein [Actinoplanes sp. N902-109]